MNFTIDQENLIGNETDFNVGLEIVTMDNTRGDRDVNPSNNNQQLSFSVDARADISVVGL